MLRRLTLRAKFGLMALLTGLLILLLAGMGALSTKRLNETLAEVAITGQALGTFMEGDMMHDALKGDVLAALLVAGGEAIATESELREALAENAATFRRTLDDNRKLPLAPEVHDAIAAVAPALEAYIAEAHAIVDLAFRDRNAALARMPAFFSTFDRLAEENEAVGTRIEQAVLDSKAHAASASEFILWLQIVTVVATLVLFVGVAAVTVRSIERPLRLCADALGRIEAGDLSVTAEHPAKDEIGRVAAAVENYRQAALRVQRLQTEAEEQRKAAEASKVQALVGMADNVEAATSQVVAEVAGKAASMADAARRMAATAVRVDENATAVSAPRRRRSPMPRRSPRRRRS